MDLKQMKKRERCLREYVLFAVTPVEYWAGQA
jgi:hypothetical protein